jgi:hypothetical protein
MHDTDTRSPGSRSYSSTGTRCPVRLDGNSSWCSPPASPAENQSPPDDGCTAAWHSRSGPSRPAAPTRSTRTGAGSTPSRSPTFSPATQPRRTHSSRPY